MADLPILFSGPMVRGLIREVERPGTGKTQTRRVLKPQPTMHAAGDCTIGGHRGPVDYLMREIYPQHLARFRKGDRLWVKETWRTEARHDAVKPTELPRAALISFDADHLQEPNDGCRGRTRVSIHMPRWASRLTLTVTDVRVQRLQECSREDAAAEGLIRLRATGRYVIAKGDQYFGDAHHDPRVVYGWLWDQINGDGSWASNPWIVALTFTVERRNIDAARAA